MDIIHVIEPFASQEGTGNEIDAAAPHFLLHPRPRADVAHFDRQADPLGQELHQRGVGAHQPRTVDAVTPQIGRIFRVAGGNQLGAFSARRQRAKCDYHCNDACKEQG